MARSVHAEIPPVDIGNFSVPTIAPVTQWLFFRNPMRLFTSSSYARMSWYNTRGSCSWRPGFLCTVEVGRFRFTTSSTNRSKGVTDTTAGQTWASGLALCFFSSFP